MTIKQVPKFLHQTEPNMFIYFVAPKSNNCEITSEGHVLLSGLKFYLLTLSQALLSERPLTHHTQSACTTYKDKRSKR